MRRRTLLWAGLGLLLAVGTPAYAAPDAEETVPSAPTWTLDDAGRLEGHEGRVRSLAFRPDGHVLATGGLDRTVRLFDVDERKALALVALPRAG